MNISVIIPVYNAEKYIVKAIESCLQLPEVKEIVVIDDGHKDRAKQTVKNLAEKHPIIKLYKHPNNENRGAGESRNLGIKKATQEYVAFLDADDFFLPNRFDKDKVIFNANPDADGCYNAIGCYFYSKKAEEVFLKKFKTQKTTVNQKANPTPENLFDGLIGNIVGYGYFSIDGLTIKRDFLIKNSLFFPISSMHEDTNFFIRLSYYGEFYPSNLEQPVALRGVHEKNRITANHQLKEQIQHYNRFKMWNSLYLWAKEKNIAKKYIIHFNDHSQYHYLLSKENPTEFKLLLYFIKNPSLIYNDRYPDIQEYYVKNKKTHWFLLRRRKNILNLLNPN